MEEKLEAIVHAHPWLQSFLGGFSLLALLGFFSLIGTLSRQWRAGSIHFDRVPVIEIPPLFLSIFFLFLAVVMMLFGGLYFYPATLVGLYVIFSHEHQTGVDRFGVRALPGWKVMAWGFWIYLAICIMTFGASAVSEFIYHRLGKPFSSQPNIDLILSTKDPRRVVFFVFYAVIMAPVTEELLFRGFLFPALKARWGLWGSWVLTALIFAALHMHMPTFLPLFLLGLVLGAIYEITGSLPLCMMVHCFFNAGTALLLLIVRHYL